MTSQEKRPSAKKIDSIFNLLRSIDLEVWTGEKWRINDIKENSEMIKRYLDEMISEYEMETGIKPKEVSTPFIDPVHKSEEWQSTPLVNRVNQLINNSLLK